MWKSQLFENDNQGGLFLALASELLPLWPGPDSRYDSLCLEDDSFLFESIGSGFGVLMSGPEGDIIHESRWIISKSGFGIILAGWNEWGDNREQWLFRQLRRERLAWRRHSRIMEVESGRLVLLHAATRGTEAVAASDNRPAVCGEYITATVEPGKYFIETVELEQRPEGENCCEICRWVPYRLRG